MRDNQSDTGGKTRENSKKKKESKYIDTIDLQEKPTEENDRDPLTNLDEKGKEAAENYDKFLRAAAELDNYKKRIAKERTDFIKYGNEALVKDMLPIVDSLDRALEHAAGSQEDFEAFISGFKLIQEQFLGCLEKHGVEKVKSIGEDFDPNIHEAVLQVESEEIGGNKVVEEFEKGYLLNGRLLRPAKVSVSKSLKKSEE